MNLPSAEKNFQPLDPLSSTNSKAVVFPAHCPHCHTVHTAHWKKCFSGPEWPHRPAWRSPTITIMTMILKKKCCLCAINPDPRIGNISWAPKDLLSPRSSNAAPLRRKLKTSDNYFSDSFKWPESGLQCKRGYIRYLRNFSVLTPEVFKYGTGA